LNVLKVHFSGFNLVLIRHRYSHSGHIRLSMQCIRIHVHIHTHTPVRLYMLSLYVQSCCRLSRIRSERLQCLVGGLLPAHTVITWPYSELSRFNSFSVRLSPGDWRVMNLRVLGCFCWQVITYVLVLGRFLRVDLKPISMSVCPSVHKKFFPIWMKFGM